MDVLPELKPQPTHSFDVVAWRETDVEIGPEEFYGLKPSQMATGRFAPTSHVDFSQSETDWDQRILLADESNLMVGDQRRGKSTLMNEPATDLPAQHIFLVAVENLRAQAEARRWLSPKSAVALSKLMLGNEDLSRSELNALGYLLDRMEGGPGLDVHTARLKEYLFGI